MLDLWTLGVAAALAALGGAALVFTSARGSAGKRRKAGPRTEPSIPVQGPADIPNRLRKRPSDFKAPGDSRSRVDFVAGYPFPAVALAVLERERPDWPPETRQAAWEGFREYAMLHALSPGRLLGMPSEAVDAAWHAFLLCDREYEAFCQEAFGARLRHAPDPSARPRPLGGEFRPKPEVAATWEAAKALRSERPDLGLPAAGALFALDASLGSGWIHTPESLAALESASGKSWSSRRSDSGGGCGGDAPSWDFPAAQVSADSDSSCSDSSSEASACDSGDGGGSSCSGSCGGGCGGD